MYRQDGIDLLSYYQGTKIMTILWMFGPQAAYLESLSLENLFYKEKTVIYYIFFNFIAEDQFIKII